MSKPSIVETHPKIAAQLIDVDPGTITHGCQRRLNWRCELGHEWDAVVEARTRTNAKGNGCPVCYGRRVLPGFNDLATRAPDIAKQLVDPDPTTVTPRSSKVGTWVCPEGHTTHVTINMRFSGAKCGFCTGRYAIPGETDLATTHPEIAAQMVTGDPSRIKAGTEKKQTWRCDLGHEWNAAPSTRAIKGHGCPYCSGLRVLRGFNDLATLDPELAATLVDPEFATTVTTHSAKKAHWRCPEGHVWTAAVFGRSNGQGCPSCSISGFDATATSANVYLLHDSTNGLTKAGISGTHVDRVKHFGQRGMSAVCVVTTSGAHAREVERELLAELKAHGTAIGKAEFKKLYDRMGGWTETVHDPDGSAMRAALDVIERAKETPSLFESVPWRRDL